MRVHLVRELAHPVRWPPGTSLTVGGLPEGEVDVVVGGTFDGELLERCRKAVVIPFAGLPAKTRELLLERPELPVYALHHNASAVAELAVGLLLAASRMILPMDRALRTHDWGPRYADDPSVELAGGTCVLLGYGAIGRRVEPVVAALGMQVVPVDSQAPEERLDAALAEARAVICALPSTADTRGLLSRRRLARLPEGCVLVNVGRGDLIDEEALYDACSAGRLRAGLDVWWQYPEGSDRVRAPSRYPFETLDTVVMSPHRAGHGAHVERDRARALEAVLDALDFGEEPAGRVDVRRGY